MTPEELEALAERVRVWAESPEGLAALDACLARAEAVAEDMRRSQRVDWRKLRDWVVTI